MIIVQKGCSINTSVLPVFLLCLSLAGCGGPWIYSSGHHEALTMTNGLLQENRLAFITPSTITGKEQDKQPLVLAFIEELEAIRPDVRYLTLAETLGQINRAGLSEDYVTMYNEYQSTGIFKRETLHKIGRIAGARYIAQLKLAEFEQETAGRWGILGLRMTETKRARIRLFLQIWDSKDGSIAWEGVHELNYADDTFSEKTPSFREVVRQTARKLVMLLPGKPNLPQGQQLSLGDDEEESI